MALKIKICGLSTEPTLDAALDAGADLIGLVLHPASPRFVDVARAAALARHIAGRAEIVLLTVDLDDAALDEAVTAIRPDWLQMHGRETPARVEELGTRYRLKTLKAIPVREPGDEEAAEAYRGAADMILFDARPPAGSNNPGGHGVPFDWSLLDGIADPFMLSGGLHPGNVAEAIRATRPAAIDVSSGVESAPGRKDPDLIAAFIAAARQAVMMEPAQ